MFKSKAAEKHINSHYALQKKISIKKPLTKKVL